jgi:AcrR family transcriptional regulator
MSKGAMTCAAILNEAVNLSSELGLEGLTIGSLAKRVGMSKSGLYAHFDSKETLQKEVLQTASDKFVESVLKPAIKYPRGVTRLRALFELWLTWGNTAFRGGCLFISAATEFDDRPGSVQQQLTGHINGMQDIIVRVAKTAIEEGEFAPSTDCDQIAFEFWGIVLAHQNYRRLLKVEDVDAKTRLAFDALLQRYLRAQ